MIRLSVNVLTSALALLNRIETYKFPSLSELAYSKIASISAEDIFIFSSNCGWVSEGKEALALTVRGAEFLHLQELGLLADIKRQMLLDYILTFAPIWSNRIPFGRREAAIYMSKDEEACFVDAGLLSDCLDSEIIDWWDAMATKIREQTQQTKNNTGRMGEQNSINYERVRTNFEPIWMSVDSNLAGYDIKSRVSRDNSETLLIEVKASTSMLSQASFHITSHEWDIASTSKAYLFHLWCLSANKTMFAAVSPDEVLPYIPTNNLAGQWESVKIPFSCFESKFIELA